MKLLPLFLGFMISSTAIAQNEDWHDAYQLGTYDEVLDICKSYIPDDSADCEIACYNYVGRFDLKFKVLFTYEDSVASCSGKTADFIGHWTKTYWPNGEFSETFVHSVKVSYKGKNFWFPVQEPTFPYYQEELAAGDEVYLYLMFAGTLVVADETHYIFVANDFE